MNLTWTFEGDRLADLLADISTPEGDAAQNIPPIRTVRFAVDEGTLKWKINEDMWSPGAEPDGSPS